MEIRRARETDNLKEIARLIYETDPYIYPYWFQNTKNWEDFLTEKIKDKGFLFHYDNILIATENGHVYGVLVFITDQTNLCYDYDKIKGINKNFQITIDNYILPVVKHVGEDLVYISNVCVDQDFRRHYIATGLIEKIKEMFPSQTLELDVLADNAAGVKLYQKEGFEKIVELKGFSAPYKRKPLVWTMQCKRV